MTTHHSNNSTVPIHLVGSEHTIEASEIAPGVYVPSEEIPRDVVPRHGVVKLMRQGDGSYIPVLKDWSATFKLTQDADAIRQALGFAIGYKTLVRLVKGGFIGASMPSPQITLIDLGSLAAHLDASRDPEFWTPERRIRYSSTAGEV